MTVASFVATQRTDHGVPHAVSCRMLGMSELLAAALFAHWSATLSVDGSAMFVDHGWLP